MGPSASTVLTTQGRIDVYGYQYNLIKQMTRFEMPNKIEGLIIQKKKYKKHLDFKPYQIPSNS